MPLGSWDMNATQLSKEQTSGGNLAGNGSPKHICGDSTDYDIQGLDVAIPRLCKP